MMYIPERGDLLESNNGTIWEVIDIKEDKIIVRMYYKGTTVGTITGLSYQDIKKYFKIP